MVEKRIISKGKYVVAIVITSAIFIFGILIGTLMTNNKFDAISNIQQELRIQILSLETQYTIVSENPCTFKDAPELTAEMYKISDNLDSLESELGKNNKELLSLVDYYSLLEIKHWLFLKEVQKKCNNYFNLVLFFYSNDEQKCIDCNAQGYVLTFLRKKYPEDNIYVYSFNNDINNLAIKALERSYNITKFPSIVVNDKTYEGLKDRNELEKILNINQ